jgi:hypothetical protein
VLDVALEVPLAQFGGRRLGQRDHARRARVQVLGEPLDRAALARGVAALEQDDVAHVVVLAPVLELEELDLELVLLGLVLLAAQQRVVGVVLAPGLHGRPPGSTSMGSGPSASPTE